MATRKKLGRRQVEILEALDGGNTLQLTGTGKKARIQFTAETEVSPPNANALGIYHENFKWLTATKPAAGKPRTFKINKAGQAALATHAEAVNPTEEVVAD